MTTCKDIPEEEKPKKTKFQVEIDIEGGGWTREDIIKRLRGDGCSPDFINQLADIIEKG